MIYLQYFIIVIYTIAIVLIFLYSLAQLNLLFNYLSSRRKKEECEKFDLENPDEVPYVTIQLPVFNEMYVMERLLENIALLEYPKDKLEIQVLDDSTDETVHSTREHVEKLASTGLDIKHITRTNRTGFKAGALKEGLKIAKGEFIAIFDADFLPQPNWLKRTIIMLIISYKPHIIVTHNTVYLLVRGSNHRMFFLWNNNIP